MMQLFAYIISSYYIIKTAGHSHNCIHEDISDGIRNYMMDQEVSYKVEQDEPHNYAFMKRKLNDNSYAPLRIHFDTTYIASPDQYACESSSQNLPILGDSSYSCGSGDVLTDTKRSFLLNTLLPTTKEWYSNTLSVIQVSKPLSVSGFSCTEPYSYACCSNQLPDEIKNEGISNTDVIIMVTARPVSSSNTIAWATACLTDQYSRPILGQINFNPAKLDPSINAREEQIATALHEMAHALGFSGNLYQYYREPGNGPLRSQVTETVEATDEDNFLGRDYVQIITPTVVEKAKEHFGCSNWVRPGLEIENGGGSGTSGSHWEKRIMENEVPKNILYFHQLL